MSNGARLVAREARRRSSAGNNIGHLRRIGIGVLCHMLAPSSMAAASSRNGMAA